MANLTGASQLDSGGIPTGSVKVPGVTLLKAIQGGAVFTDALGDDSAPAPFEITASSKNTDAAAAVIGDLMTAKLMPQFIGPQTATYFPTQQMPQVVWDFNGPGGPPTLRAAAQVLAISFGGATLVATTTFSPFMIWTEE